MIGAVVEHGHKIAIATDQYDAVNRLAIYETHNVHTEVEVEVGLLRAAGERLVVLSSDAITQALDGLQEHLLIAGLRTGGTVGMRPDQAAIATQEVEQLAKIHCHAQRASRVEQVGNINEDTNALIRWEWRHRNRDVGRSLVRPSQFRYHAVC